MAIKTDNVTDIKEYYGIFKEIDERPLFLIKNMSVALIIQGKYLLSKKRETEGLECFEQSAIISQANKQFLLYIIEYLLFYGYLKEINRFINRFNPDDRTSNEFKITQFIKNASTLQPQQVIQQAQELLKNGIESVGVYLLLIQNLVSQERFPEALRYCAITQEKWPEKNYFFDELTNKLPTSSEEKDAG